MSAAARPVREAIEAATTTAGITQAVIGALVAAVATSRAAHHTLSAPAVVGLVAGWAFTLACLGWPQGFYAGAAQVIAGEVVFDDRPFPGADWSPDAAALGAERRSRRVDGFEGRTVRRTALEVGALAAAWAVLGAGMVAAVLNGREARWVVVAACLAGLAGTAAVVVDIAARRHGMAAARASQATASPVGVRRRAWKQVALPLAVFQAGVNGGAAWVLFHSYHHAVGAPLLTAKVAVADAPVSIVILGVLFSGLASAWGGVDAALGRVRVPAVGGSPGAQAGGDAGGSARGISGAARGAQADGVLVAPLGAQAAVYVGILGLLLAKLIEMVLPSAPTLWEVGIARGLFAGLLVVAFSGLGYVRGACNGVRREPRPVTEAWRLIGAPA